MSRLKTAIAYVGLGLAMVGSVMLPAVAGEETSSTLRQGLPGRRISGGARSECMAADSAHIVALNPATHVGETTSAEPSVFFVVPELPSAYPLEFSLRDGDGNRVFEKSLNTRENFGVVGIQLPPQALEANQDYRWRMSVVCDAYDRTQDDVLFGWLRRVEPETAVNTERAVADSEIASELVLAANYQQAGLWNDAISTLANLREQYPTDSSVRDSWNQMLQVLEVEHVVSNSYGPMATNR